jgi:hypothetical protein
MNFKENTMLSKKLLLVSVALTILLTAAMIMAGSSGSAKFKVPRAMLIAGTEINSGLYEVKWESQSPEVTVIFAAKGEVAAKAAGKIVERDRRFDSNSLVISKDASGREEIKELRFNGKKFSIVLQ